MAEKNQVFGAVEILSPYGVLDDALKIANSTESTIAYTFGNILENEDEYTFSCWMKSDAEIYLNIYVSNSINRVLINTEWQRIVFAAISEIEISKEVKFTIPAGATLYAYEGQLEHGNKATDFSPNPDDILEDIGYVDNKVTTLQTDFTVEQGEIRGLITEKTTITNEDGTTTEVKNAYSEMKQTVGEIQTTVSETKKDVGTLQSTVQQNAEAIVARATKEDVGELEGRVAEAEAQITPDAIVLTVTQSDTYTNDLGEKVSTNKVVSSINASAEGVQIEAEKINLKGAITAECLDSGLGTIIRSSQDAIEFIKNNSSEDGKKIVVEWAKFDGATLTLGVEGLPRMATLSNEALTFYNEGAESAWLSNQELWANAVRSGKFVEVGNLRLVKEDDEENGYSLM